MSVCDVVGDVKSICTRLLDHKAFLTGEIQLMCREFEHERGDSEVEDLLLILENIGEVRTTQLDQFKSFANHTPQVNGRLHKAIGLCHDILDLETKYKKNDRLESNRKERVKERENFISDLTKKFHNIDKECECKEKEISSYFEDLERKLKKQVF